MNGNSNGTEYAYYEYYGKKNLHKDFHKRNLRKDFIERLIAQDALSLLTDENIERIAETACNRNDFENAQDSPFPRIRDRVHEVELSLTNLTKAIESGAAPDALVKRMMELEKEKDTFSSIVNFCFCGIRMLPL